MSALPAIDLLLLTIVCGVVARNNLVPAQPAAGRSAYKSPTLLDGPMTLIAF